MSDNKAEALEVEIIDQPVVEETKIDLSGLQEEEQKMAKDLGLAPKEEAKKEDVKVEDKKSFEDVEKNEKNLLGEYNKNEQALYFKWKTDKKVRQEAQAERDLTLLKEKSLRIELEKSKEEGTLTTGKLNAIDKLLTGDQDNITIEAIQEILATPKKFEDKEKPLTRSDLEQMQAESDAKTKAEAESNKQFVSRMNSLDDYGKSNLENYEEVISCAKDILDGKVELSGVIDKNDIARRLVEKVNDKNNDEEDIAEFVLGIAKLNPNFGKKKEEKKDAKSEKLDGKDSKKVSSDDIDKIVKNAAKSQSSAQVSGGNSRRVVSYDDLTVEDASKLSTEQWNKLPKEVRMRLLK